jgi:hypothetical protein
MGSMASHPRGADDTARAALVYGEVLVAATYAESFTDTDDVMSALFGSPGRKLARSAGAQEQPPPLPGLAGTVPRGEVLVAVTNMRVLVFARQGTQIDPAPWWFEPPAIASVSLTKAVVVGVDKLQLRFGDGTSVFLGLPRSHHARHVEKAATALLAGTPR